MSGRVFNWRVKTAWSNGQSAALAAALSVALAHKAFADAPAPLISDTKIQNAQITGTAQLKWLGLPVFDALLMTGNSRPYAKGTDAALELTYRMRFSKESLLRATMEQMQNIEGTQPDQPVIQTKLAACFADVRAGDQFLALGIAPDRLELYLNADQTCLVKHPGIADRFLAIWLSPQSRFPKLSQELTGQ